MTKILQVEPNTLALVPRHNPIALLQAQFLETLSQVPTLHPCIIYNFIYACITIKLINEIISS
jgi:hypothetical protein